MNQTVSIPRIVIAGTHSGSGKTTLTLAIVAGLMRSGMRVQVFKAGPDFIDPSHHSAITLRPARNLDTWMLTESQVLGIFQDGAKDANIAVVEGVMGLFDGSRDNGETGSTAHLAKLLKAPVVLIVDARGMGRSAAAMIAGYQQFDKQVEIAGVLFNNVGSPQHYDVLKKAVCSKLPVQVLGFLPRMPQAAIPERHLGLVPSQEHGDIQKVVQTLADVAVQTVDFKKLIALSGQASALPVTQTLFAGKKSASSCKNPRIAIAWDKAFHFYYHENLQLLTLGGAELVHFSPLSDTVLPRDIAMVYLGGGFPEMHAEALSRNTAMRHAIADFMLNRKRPVYAECGGLMYLCEAIRDFQGRSFPMVGAIPAEAAMGRQRNALGYVQADVLADNLLSKKGQSLRGHEFHWSHLEKRPGFERLGFAYRLRNSLGENEKPDGIMIENSLASYTHLHFANAPQLVDRLLNQL